MANIRVSEWAKQELARHAKEEGRTVVAIVDRLLHQVSGNYEYLTALDEGRPDRARYPQVSRQDDPEGYAEYQSLRKPKELKYERDE